jgi:branched-chain amino acid transport system ATP-binding protein
LCVDGPPIALDFVYLLLASRAPSDRSLEFRHIMDGRNGAGKTTRLLTIMGNIKPRSARISYRPRDIAKSQPYEIARSGVGYVPQELFPSLTVLENLTVFARKGRGGLWSLQQMYELFPLEERSGNLGFQLLGGEHQMLLIARALMLNPTLLLLDEPSEKLAPMASSKL